MNSLLALWGFVDETTFLTKAGHVGVVYRLQGVDYECLDHPQRRAIVAPLRAGAPATRRAVPRLSVRDQAADRADRARRPARSRSRTRRFSARTRTSTADGTSSSSSTVPGRALRGADGAAHAAHGFGTSGGRRRRRPPRPGCRRDQAVSTPRRRPGSRRRDAPSEGATRSRSSSATFGLQPTAKGARRSASSGGS